MKEYEGIWWNVQKHDGKLKNIKNLVQTWKNLKEHEKWRNLKKGEGYKRNFKKHEGLLRYMLER